MLSFLDSVSGERGHAFLRQQYVNFLRHCSNALIRLYTALPQKLKGWVWGGGGAPEIKGGGEQEKGSKMPQPVFLSLSPRTAH